ncbi:MAG: high-molecular-weight cytochrome [Geobacteraceae bacterium]|nr:MAG: high-molecular-weight cytochrome [Geobacteraceae bacterium]
MARQFGAGKRMGAVLYGLITLAIVFVVAGPVQAAPQYNFTCSSCHGMPPLDSATRDTSNGAFQGNHQTHQPAGAQIQNCAVCHNAAGYTNSHLNGQISLQANINSSPATGQYKVDGAAVAFKNQTSVPKLGTCSNVNCHFEDISPTWGSANFSTTIDCSQCHTTPGSSAAHTKHDAYYSWASNGCIKCHPDYKTGLKFSHATSAGNRGISVTLSEGGYGL